MPFKAWWLDQVVLATGSVTIEIRPKVQQADCLKHIAAGSCRPQGSNAPPGHLLSSIPASICIDRRVERYVNKSQKCIQIDGEPCTNSCHTEEFQNTVDSTKLAADISVPFLPQDEPTASVKRLLQQGHSPSNPFDIAEKADGCGIVMIALNAVTVHSLISVRGAIWGLVCW